MTADAVFRSMAFDYSHRIDAVVELCHKDHDWTLEEFRERVLRAAITSWPKGKGSE